MPAAGSGPAATRLRTDAQSALARAGQADPALALLDRLAATPRSSDEIARLRVARGLALAGDAQGRAAAEAFGAAARDGLPATKILARFLAAQSADIHGLSDVARAPEELASQRPLWRGHPAERRMLDFLAGLYSRKGDHEQALSTWSAALALPSDDPPTGVITARMRDALVAALTGEGGRSDPVTAYTLYRTYPDLLADPAPVADRLAARVADVGLPGLAARLVERLLPSPDRPGRGTELARYWAAAGEPDLALAALPPGTGGPAGSAVRSQALLDLGRPAEALGELPAGHAGPDVAERRPEALWRLRDWRTLLREHQGGLAAPGPDDPPTGRDSLLLLRTAIATTAVQEGGRPGEPAPHPNDRASVFLAMAEAARPATSPVAATVAALPGRLAKLRAGLDALRRPLPDHGR
jgi:hypothetical protein